MAFRELYGGGIEGAWAVLSKPVDQLVGGEAYMFHRYALPYDHPSRMAGEISDLLVLTADDRLVLYGEYVTESSAAISD